MDASKLVGRRRSRVGAVRAAAVVAALLAAALALYWWQLSGLRPAGGNHLVLWPLVGVSTWAASTQTIPVRDRKGSVSSSLDELPLFVAMVLLAPAAALSAVFAGQFAAQLQLRKPVKAVSNCLALSVAMGLGTIGYDHLLGGHSPVSLWGWLVGVGALAAVVLVDYVAVVVARAALDWRWRHPPLRRIALQAVLETCFCTVGGLAAVTVAHVSLWALLVIAGLFVAPLLGWRAAGRAAERRTRLEKIYSFTQALAAAESGETKVVEVVLEQARSLLAANHAELVAPLQAPLDGLVVRCWLSGEGPVRIDDAVPRADLAYAAAECASVLLPPGNDARLASPTGERPRGGVVAPLRPGDPLSGYLLVGDRLFSHEGFGADDVQLLQALAAGAAVALRRGGLLDRLRHEAAVKEHEAHHDALTGLANRALFSERLDGALSNPRARVAVALLDLDNFKQVNDTLGHQAGDAVLAEVARRLGPLADSATLVARLGGDEFAILFEGVRDTDVCVARVQETLATIGTPMLIGSIDLAIAASAGVATSGKGRADPGSLLRYADIAMYQAKADGRGVRTYEPSNDRTTLRRLTMATELRKAIESGSLQLYYQPVVELATGQVIGCEALARWSHEHFGPIPPDEFIPVAERAGLIEPLTWWALDTALAQAKDWRRLVPTFSVAVNLSAVSLVKAHMVDRVLDALGRAGLGPDALRLELTESSMMAERGTAALYDLSELGIALSIDDFGTGYSSLTRLRHLPFDEVKIDKSFVTEMCRAGDDEAVVRSVIELAKGLDKMATAEGVEDRATMHRLTALGCHAVQGYYLAKPLPAHQCETFLTAVTRWPNTIEALSSPQGGPAGTPPN
ncbi:MAG: putative bifunctional diguanylate cyclase/phosphodiesterase [Acidimicrobiales bacterium]